MKEQDLEDTSPIGDCIGMLGNRISSSLDNFLNSAIASGFFFHAAPTTIRDYNKGGYEFVRSLSGKIGLYSGAAFQAGFYGLLISEKGWKMAAIPLATNAVSAGCALYRRMIEGPMDEGD